MKQNEIEVKMKMSGNVPNIFVYRDGELIVKLWIYEDGKVSYRTFEPEVTPEKVLLDLRDIQESVEYNR